MTHFQKQRKSYKNTRKNRSHDMKNNNKYYVYAYTRFLYIKKTFVFPEFSRDDLGGGSPVQFQRGRCKSNARRQSEATFSAVNNISDIISEPGSISVCAVIENSTQRKSSARRAETLLDLYRKKIIFSGWKL